MTEERLYTSGLKVCPDNAKVRFLLNIDEFAKIDIQSMIPLIVLFFSWLQIYYNIAKLSADKGDSDLAFKYYHKAIE